MAKAAPPTAPRTPDGAAVHCEHAEACGGCPLIALPYLAQLGAKRQRVEAARDRFAGLDAIDVAPTLPAEPVAAYRTRAKLVVGGGGQIGLYARGGGHQLVDIPGCQVLSPALSRVVATLRERVRSAEAEGALLGASSATSTGALRAVDLRDVHDPNDGTARVLATLIVERRRVSDIDRVRAEAQALMAAEPLIAGVAVSLHDGTSPQLLGDEPQLLVGPPHLADRVGLSVHHASYGAFVQAHRGQSARIHAALREAVGRLGPAPQVLDLYGGAGAIALALAADGARVHLVEAFARAAAEARAAAAAQGLALTVEGADALPSLRGLAARGAAFDAIVTNPPRRGMAPSARELVASLGPRLLAYVSCDPDTLARDLDHLGRLGFRPRRLIPLDMIPLTEEVETLALLERADVTRPRVLYEDDDFFVVEKSGHEPTVPQGEYTTSLMARVRLLPNAERATPVHRLDVGTSGLVLFAKSPEGVETFTKGAPCRRVYLAAVRGVPPMKGAVTRDLREGGVRYAARTRYRRLAALGGHGILRAVPEVGRTHQVRRHLAAAGHPILGDDRYGHGPTNRYFEERHTLDRTFLHCVRLEFTHPKSGAKHTVEAPLPGDLCTVLLRLGGSDALHFLEQKNALGGLTSMPPPGDSDASGSSLDVVVPSAPLLPREPPDGA